LRIDEQVSKHGMTLGNNTLRFSNWNLAWNLLPLFFKQFFLIPPQHWSWHNLSKRKGKIIY
jgi:hypothetical protein